MKHGRVVKIVFLSFTAFIAFCLVVGASYVGIVASAAKLDTDKLDTDSRRTKVLDFTGAAMGNDGYISIADIPANLINAFIAVEDKRFYTHHGLDYRRIAGAILSNLKTHSLGQGASTITCQLIKNTHLTQEKTLNRKIKEAKLALELERTYSKEQILEAYLNVIYLGAGTYGVKEASRRYFGADPDALSLAQCASLAAITVNPAIYSPLLNPDNNHNRRNMVLRLMREQGYIGEDEEQQAAQEPVTTVESSTDIYETYRINALDEASRMTGISPKQLAQGYTVYTYCDSTEQKRAYDTLSNAEGDRMLLLADRSGEIRAYNATFSHTVNSIRRQIGSTIKPFVYAAAIEKDCLLPDTQVEDEPQTFAGYAPKNYHDVYLGRISARDALAHSSNVAAVKVLGYAGLDYTFRYIKSVGLPLHEDDKHLALALGGLTYGCTFDELATAYCTLASGGVKNNAAFVHKVTDADGNVIYRRDASPERVMSAATAYLVTDMLQQTASVGTAKKLADLYIPVAAKTGTVGAGDSNSDAWCVAYTHDVLCLSWAGNLSMQEDKMIAATGGGEPTGYVKKMLRGRQAIPFEMPQDVEFREIDAYTLQRDGTLCAATPNTPDAYRRTIVAKRTVALPPSSAFERIPSVDNASIRIQNDMVYLCFDKQELCSYQILYDSGFEQSIVAVIPPSQTDETVEFCYDFAVGWWSIEPILHGKTDIIGKEYRALVL